MEPEQAWKKVLSVIKDEVSISNYRTWFSNTKCAGLNENTITIAVPSAFIKNMLVSRYNTLISKAVSQVLEKDNINLDFIIDASLTPAKKIKVTEEDEDENDDLFQTPSTPKHVYTSSVNINPKYTMESYVVGLTNNLAYAAAQAVVQNPGVSYNPLYIYGPSGVGKTHLMQAIGNALIKKNPFLKVMYASSEKFMNDFVESIQTKKTGEFRQKYRTSNILLIDDIQFISGKDSTQEEFFHTFNDLHSKNSQLIFTSDRPPHEIEKLEERLRSRFQGGLMVDIQLPDFDTRMAILKAKLLEKGESVPEDLLKMIAETVQSNTRELEGKLVQIIQLKKLSSGIPDEEIIKKYLGKPTVVQTAAPDYKKVLAGINQYFNVKMPDLLGPRRQKELVLPRQIAMFIMYEECKLPMEKIGQILGGRDHTTVMHGVDKIKEAISRDREIQRMLIELKQHIHN